MSYDVFLSCPLTESFYHRGHSYTQGEVVKSLRFVEVWLLEDEGSVHELVETSLLQDQDPQVSGWRVVDLDKKEIHIPRSKIYLANG